VVRCLSFHAGYRCRRSGACCTSNWPIPIEADRLERARAAIANGALTPVARDVPPFETPAGTPEGSALVGVANHACVFFERGARSCRIHETLGHDALPLACRQFPRVSVRDPRGVSLTLSAYCPTASTLLHSSAPVTIVESPAAFPDTGEYEGLDARTALPPLLTRDRLMDWESWWRVEARAVELLTESGDSAADALGRLRAAVESTIGWTPNDGQLIDRIDDAFETIRTTAGDCRHASHLDPAAVARRRAAVEESIPEDLQSSTAPRQAVVAVSPPSDAVLRRFLASHAFANWTMHVGQGLRAWLRSIEAAHALVASGLDVRAADLRLRHLADPEALARKWSAG